MAASVYTHVPFCLGRCAYCAFYSGEALADLEGYPQLLVQELARRKGEFTEPLRTVYFGGGTSALLGQRGLAHVLRALESVAGLSPQVEVTVEYNPEVAVGPERIRSVGVNRLSVGVQALEDRLLRLLGRRADAAACRRALARAGRAGFTGLNVDLILGLPGLTPATLAAWIAELVEFGIDHLSSYVLELHPGTPLQRAIETGALSAASEAETEDQYAALADAAEGAGLRRYEVSNWALPGRESRHNLCVWGGESYVGLGPGAHGYDADHRPWGRRSWNSADLSAYGAALRGGGAPPGGAEVLTREEALLERLFLTLRRPGPFHPERIATRYGLDTTRLAELLTFLARQGLLSPVSGGGFTVTGAGLRRADGLAGWLHERLLPTDSAA